MTYGEAYLEGWKNIFNYEGVSIASSSGRL